MAVILKIGDILEAKIFCSNGQQQGINVLHYRVKSFTGAAYSDAAFADKMSQSAAPLYKVYLPTACRYEGVRAQVIFPLPVQAAQVSTNSAGFGTVIADPLPSQASFLVKKNTALAGRRFRGRMYLPFWGESMSDATGRPTGPANTAALDIATLLLTEQTWGVFPDQVVLTPVLWSREFSDYQAVTGVVLRAAWATQRRRSLINKGDTIGP
jgi:hypothetical protein